MNSDTSRAARAHYVQLLRSMSPAERFRQAARITSGVRTMAMAGLRSRYANADEAELRKRLIVRLYGRPAAIRLCGSIPDDAL